MRIEPSVIVLEFNELTPSLVNRFMAEGHLPSFQRFYNESLVYTSDAEEEGLTLNPWVQWVTAHSGLDYKQHQVYRLNEARKVNEKAVWDFLSERGYKVWICGSMNPWCKSPLNGCLLPDPWSVDISPQPEELQPFHRYVALQVQEHTNPELKGSKLDSLRFLKFLCTHGLSMSTIGSVFSQLLCERFTNCRWKRAALLDQIQWDVFRWYYNAVKPNFATFFINSTAHYQHRFWRHMDPDSFDLKPEPRETKAYSSAILYGHKKMDRLLGKFFSLAGSATTLILMSGLGQQPFLKFESAGGKHYYRPREMKNLLQKLGISDQFSFEAVMAEEFSLRFDDDRAATNAHSLLDSLHLGNEKVLKTRRQGSQLFVHCRTHRTVAESEMLQNAKSRDVAAFYEFFYKIDAVKSAMHHPHGLLWIRRPDRTHIVHRETVPLRAVAPTILEILGVKRPEYMAEPLLGRLGNGSSNPQVVRSRT